MSEKCKNTIKIKKFEGNNDLLESGTLYCFDYNLKGLICNQCESKNRCIDEYNKLKKFADKLKKICK